MLIISDWHRKCLKRPQAGVSEERAMFYRPKVAAQIVGIGESTLRAWSHRFTDLLSLSARPGATMRHYNERDLAIFKRSKALLDGGLTFDQVARQLAHELGGVGSAIAFTGDAQRVADLEAQIEVLQLLLAAKEELLSSLRAQLLTAWADLDAIVAMRAQASARRR